MADLVRNDPTQTIPASNALVDTIESFNQTVRAAAEQISNSRATEGAVQQASVAAAEALRASVDVLLGGLDACNQFVSKGLGKAGSHNVSP